MALKLIVPPAVLPVDLDEAKIHERVDLNDLENNNSIEAMLYTATRYAEEYTRRAFITQTWQYDTVQFGPILEVPRPRLRTVTSITYTDWNNVTTTIDPTTYFINTIYEPGRIIFKSNSSFPFPWAYWDGWCGGGFLSVVFKAGFGDTADDVPQDIKNGILQIFGHLYENREGQPLYPGSFAYDLLNPFQVYYL